MCTSLAAQNPQQKEYADGTVQRPNDPSFSLTVGGRKELPNAVDVPLGDGFAGAARHSILSRRERIRQAVEGE